MFCLLEPSLLAWVSSNDKPQLDFKMSLGKSLAYTRTDFTNPSGELVAFGR